MEVGLWSISDVSVELSPESKFQNQPRKLPSGVVIEDMSNGCSRVTWVVHMEISENSSPPHEIYRDLVSSGKAFGAQRWVSTLKRKSERQDTVGGVPSEEGKISLMRLSQRMVCNFCSSLGSSGNNQKWTHLSRLNDVGVRVTVHRSSDPGQANDMVLSAATSIWVPVDCDTVFSFLRDERSRSQVNNQINTLSNIKYRFIIVLISDNLTTSGMFYLMEIPFKKWRKLRMDPTPPIRFLSSNR